MKICRFPIKITFCFFSFNLLFLLLVNESTIIYDDYRTQNEFKKDIIFLVRNIRKVIENFCINLHLIELHFFFLIDNSWKYTRWKIEERFKKSLVNANRSGWNNKGFLITRIENIKELNKKYSFRIVCTQIGSI